MIIVASMWVASFAMTTLDTTNRLARYTFTEIIEPIKYNLPKIYKFLTNKWIASMIPAIIGITLAWSGAWSVLWPAFGGANQMLASIALMTITAWTIKVQRAKGMNILIPALFLWITVTLAMGWYLFFIIPHFFEKDHPFQAVSLGVMVVIMIGLNLLLIYDYFTSKK